MGGGPLLLLLLLSPPPLVIGIPPPPPTEEEDLLELEREFAINHRGIIEEYYDLFYSIYEYQKDLNEFAEDLSGGYYIRYTVESVLLDADGRALLCEAIWLYGVMLMLMERFLPVSFSASVCARGGPRSRTNDERRTTMTEIHGVFFSRLTHRLIRTISPRSFVCFVLATPPLLSSRAPRPGKGPVRERLVIAYFRLFGRDGDISRIDLICKLTKSTGILPPPPPTPPPSSNASSSSTSSSPTPGTFSYSDRSFKYPTDDERLFSRFPLPPDLIRNVVGCLVSDDVYRQSSAFPNIDHRSTRLSRQASMLYVILYFDPAVLRDERPRMREVVDKYFHDNWVVHVYGGVTADLGLEWGRFDAARSALDNVLSSTTDGVRRMHVNNAKLVGQCMAELRAYLTMGILTDPFVLDNRHDLLNCLRRCNIAIRWRVLHRRTANPAFRAIVCVAPDRVTTDPRLEADFAINDTHVVSLILLTSQLEMQLKSIFRDLLERRGSIWVACRSRACGIMRDLSDYYRGDRTLARVSRHDGLIAWFSSMAGEIGDLAYDADEHFTVTGRRIQLCVRALEEVETYDMVDRDVQVKSFLGESRDLLLQMARAVGVTKDVCEDIRWISDMSYGIEAMRSYVQILHSRISKDPSNVSLLQGFFAKLSSSLDGSVERLRQLRSPEVDRVTGYYSSRLVTFVRDVLGIVPVSVFAILVQMSDILERRLQKLPCRVQGDKLIAYAQLGERYKLNMMAHEISIYADGERATPRVEFH